MIGYQLWEGKVKWSEVSQSCPTLCDPMDCGPPGSSVHGIFQAWILEQVAISFSRGSSQPRDRTQVSCIAGRHFTVWATREVPREGKRRTKGGPKKSVRDLRDAKVKVKGVSCSAVSDSLQSTDYSLPGSSVHGIFQGKNTGMGWHLLRQGIFPTNQTHISCVCLYWQLGSLPLAPPEWVA